MKLLQRKIIPAEPPLPREPLLELTYREAESLSDWGRGRDVASFLSKGRVRPEGLSLVADELIPQPLQDRLAGRLSSDSYSGMLLRLLTPPLAICGALTLSRPFLSMGQLQTAASFIGAIAAGCIVGRMAADRYHKYAARGASFALRSGRVDSPVAQEILALVIRDAKDAQGAFEVLSGCPMHSRSQSELAQAVYAHGTAEQAKTLADSGKLLDSFGLHLLQLKASSLDDKL